MDQNRITNPIVEKADQTKQARIATSHSSFGVALRSPAFLVLLLSEAVSLIGDRILLVALITLVYEQMGSSAAVGLLAMLKSIPALALGTLAGVFVDRWSRKWIMVASNLLQAIMVVCIPWISALPVVFGLYFGMAIVSQFFVPARSATIPALVPEAALTAANSLFAMAFVGAIVIGPALGGWITDSAGLHMAFYVDGLTFLVPAVAVGCLAIPRTGIARQARKLGADWREGLSVARSQPKFRIALLLLTTAGLLIAGLSTLGVMVIRQKLGGSAGQFGLMMSATGLGMLLGAASSNRVATRLEKRGISRLQLGAIGAALAGCGMAGLALSPRLELAIASGCLLGLGFVTIQVHAQTALQSAPDQMRGRLLGLSNALMGSMTFLVAGLSGLIAARTGATPVLLALASIVISTSILLRSQDEHD